MFDGAILRCDGVSFHERTRRECRDASGEVCIGVSVKQRGRLPLRGEDWMSSTWNRTSQWNAEIKLRAISMVHGAKKCLYNAVRCMGVPNSYEVPSNDGPYSVNDYNVNATNW